MKKLITKVLLMVMLLILPSSFKVNAADIQINSKELMLNFYEELPIQEDWGTLRHDQQIELCQIPEDTLKVLDTDSLVDIVLNYPLYMDIYAFDTIKLGMSVLRDNYNGLDELVNRTDASKIILDKYISMEPITSIILSGTSDVFELANIEALLSQDFILDDFSKQELDLLDKTVKKKYDVKNEHSDIYAFTKTMFYDAYNEVDSSLIQSTATVYTPKGSTVSVEKYGELLSTTEKKNMDDYISNTYSSGIKLSGATTNYNCHSYAWYLASTSNLYWMGNPATYWQDGSYYSTSTAAVNNKIVFRDNGTVTHSGIVKNITNLAPTGLGIYSKWGQYGLYNHAPAYSPYWNNSSVTLTQYKQ